MCPNTLGVKASNSAALRSTTKIPAEVRRRNRARRVELIKSEYGKDNLDFANALVNGEKLDLTSYKGANVDEFISKLDNLAKTKLNDIYSGITFTVGSEENPTLKIAKAGEDKTYELRKNEGYAQDAHYDVISVCSRLTSRVT